MDTKAKVDVIITARERDLGGFSVRRILPYATHRMVGPFIFFDHMGPAQLAPGHGMDVRPHPHIGLATVTYLFEGRIGHRDSLGSDTVIEPGAVNWMTAGHGIVHSERTPEPERARGSTMNGIQLWVALPREFEDCAPSFSHHPKDTLPEFKVGDADVKLLLGRAFDRESPVAVHSDLFYAEIKAPAGASVDLATDGREVALYVVSGRLRVDDRDVAATEMVILTPSARAAFTATEAAHVMVIGGSPVGERFLYWNFVASRKALLEEAKREWAPGPRVASSRFQPVPGDDQEFIPLPVEPGQPKGTIM